MRSKVIRICGGTRQWLVALAVLGGWTCLAPARAAELFWSGPGTWNTTAQNWGTVSGGPYDAAIWNNSALDTATFEGTADTVTLSGSLAANALSFTVDGYTLTGGTLGLAGTTPSLSVTTGTATIASLLTVAAGATKTGAGTLVLSAANGAGFAGGVTISAGVLQLGSQAGVGSGTITLGDASTGSSNVQLTLGTNIDRSGFNNPITVSNQGTGSATIKWIETGAGSSSGNGTITLNRATTFDATQISGGFFLVNHALSGTGGMTLTNSNGTRFLLQANSSGYTGDITVQSGGIFEPRDRLSASTGNNVTVEDGGELRIQFDATSIGGLSGAGIVQSESGPQTLSVGKGNASGTFSGILRNGGNVLSFRKVGSGTQTLSGSNA